MIITHFEWAFAFYFMVQKDKVLSTDRFEAKWVCNSTKKPFIFTTSSLKRSNKYFVNNCYFKVDRPLPK